MLALTGQSLSLEEIHAVAHGTQIAGLAPAARRRMEAARLTIEGILAEGRTVYGVNTGFGKLSDYSISPDELGQLQLNLVRSHCCGVGRPLSEPEVRAMMLLRANVLALGFSGARPEVAETLLAMLERGVHPVVPEKGSVGASGDLAPLAHLALVRHRRGGSLRATARGCRAPRRCDGCGIAPLRLEVKEGLALLNGTQAMAAVGALRCTGAERLARAADAAGAMTLEALRGTPVAFDERIHRPDRSSGQEEVAAHLRELLAGSEIRESHVFDDPRVQDAYSLRCMPQVHGAVAEHAAPHARRRSRSKAGRPPTTRWCSPRRATCSRAATSMARRWRWPSISRRSR